MSYKQYEMHRQVHRTDVVPELAGRRSRLSEECMVLLRRKKKISVLGSVPTWVSVKKRKGVLKRSVFDHQRRRGQKTSTFTAR